MVGRSWRRLENYYVVIIVVVVVVAAVVVVCVLQLTELDVQEFRSILSCEGSGRDGEGGERVVTDPATIAPHNTDWLHSLRGQSQMMLRPRTTQEVSQILAHCNKRRSFAIHVHVCSMVYYRT